ncbi:glycerate kinase [Schistocerca gregaria]|uniref:glycerate kinase n=1 Tax=Schistocerca gregaria TaxID=7010 RepID=UPI00211EB4B9|nr:glycerate kinase [Schistocerca gregaria]
MVKLITFGKNYLRMFCYNNFSKHAKFLSHKSGVAAEKMNTDVNEMKTLSRKMFEKAVESVQPHNIIRENVKLSDTKLFVQNETYIVNENCYIVGFGKAVLGMAVEIENILGKHLVTGIVSVPLGILDTFKNMPHMLPMENTKLQVVEGAENNLPDENALAASRKIEALLRSLNESSLVIVLISGGGSALLPAPVPPLTLGEKIETIKLLSSAGANIMELNCIRKTLSYLKGGGLAKLAYPAQIISLILSDVVEDNLGYIASGPTVPNTDGINDALNIIKKYDLLDRIPLSVSTVLSNTASHALDCFPHTQNLIIGNNSIALYSAATEASVNGYHPVVLTRSIFHSVQEVCRAYILLITNICKFLSGQISEKKFLNTFATVTYNIPLETDLQEKLLQGLYNFSETNGLCLLAGGETTVQVKGKGKGGRNQELALLFSLSLQDALKDEPDLNKYNILLLSAGTDGIDGPTEAAGAIGYNQQVEIAEKCNLNITEYLRNNDSHNFYLKLGISDDLIITGHTGTNVMDVHIIIIKAAKVCKCCKMSEKL